MSQETDQPDPNMIADFILEAANESKDFALRQVERLLTRILETYPSAAEEWAGRATVILYATLGDGFTDAANEAHRFCVCRQCLLTHLVLQGALERAAQRRLAARKEPPT